ncbi:hypothetical protein SORBI_3009G229600 [Sorghum bicolor]|uniref:TATA element modulatory factor 1 TATA binding domain-containing protein n=1 Tax=Sorghum bicolor TaxID=4558 RepID=A0A1B6PA21_SORBI|nr:hypothetical protein SORBI_3009G229600 [Sorghum bicolor]
MAWWSGKVSLGGLQDIAGAVNKISESVKNIEKNFDSALGLEEKRDDEEASGSRTSNSDRIGFFNPVMAFMGHNGEEDGTEVSEKPQSPKNLSAEEENHSTPTKKQISEVDPSEVSGTTSPKQPSKSEESHSISNESPVSMADVSEQSMIPQTPTHPSVAEEKIDVSTEAPALKVGDAEAPETSQSPGHPSTVEKNQDHEDSKHSGPSDESEPNQLRESAGDLPDGSASSSSPTKIDKSSDTETGESIHTGKEDTSDGNASQSQPAESTLASPDNITEADDKIAQEYDAPKELSSPQENSDTVDRVTHLEVKLHDGNINTEKSEDERNKMEAGEASVVVQEDNVMEQPEDLTSKSITAVHDSHLQNESVVSSTDVPAGLGGVGPASDFTKEEKIPESVRSTDSQILGSVVSVAELEKLRREMKMMEAALQGAARQSQSKADEIARLMNENEQLKSTIDDLKSKSSEAEMDALKDEYHQRVATLERKVYALTRERDTLRREQNKKSDAAALLKEKDEIINQVMAEGEELSKKQAAQEATIRKLRAQIRELEEEKQRLNSRIQVEEAKVESTKRDKAATEKLLQETIERNQTELAAQKEFYTNALNAAKEAEALAEARVNSEAKVELENLLREAGEKENMLIKTIEELRHSLTRQEQEAAFREERLKRDYDDLQKRYQASELRYNELVTQVPESTRPLLRQIEAMQETAARREEAWAGVERTLNSRLQEAEAKAAASEEKERSINERLSQTLSRITVLETQITILRTEQTQLSRSLEKERQRASESRQEYLTIKEELVKMTEQCEKLRTEAAAVPGLRAELEALKQRHFQALELMGERDEELEELRNDIVDLKEMYREQVDLLVSQLQALGARV